MASSAKPLFEDNPGEGIRRKGEILMGHYTDSKNRSLLFVKEKDEHE
jgi:hypothetical protein